MTCASASARLLAMVMCAPKPIDTGWSGAAASSSSRRGKRFSGMRKSCIGLPVATIHVPGGILARLRAYHLENMRDRADIGAEVAHVDLVQRRGTIVGEMDMRIGQARNDGAALELQNRRPGSAQLEHFLAGADRHDPAHLDGDGLEFAIAGIGRQHLAVG